MTAGVAPVAPAPVAVLGLGRMGVPIAHRLLAAGHEVAVWNRSREALRPLVDAGAHPLETPGDAPAAAGVWITMLSDDAAVRAVAVGEDGLLAHAGGSGLWIDMATISPGCSRELAEAATAAGVDYLRAPVSGNPSVVVAGNLTIVVSGDRAAYDRAHDVLAAVGPNLFHVGDGEEARILKLALNIMIAGTAELMAEAIVLCESNGLGRETLLGVMGGSAVGSPFVKYKTGALVARDYATTFTTRAMAKDLRLARAATSAELPVAAAIAALVDECAALGWGEDDLMALLPRLQVAAGLDPDLEPR